MPPFVNLTIKLPLETTDVIVYQEKRLKPALCALIFMNLCCIF